MRSKCIPGVSGLAPSAGSRRRSEIARNVPVRLGKREDEKRNLTTLSLLALPLLFVIAPVTTLARKHDGDPGCVLLYRTDSTKCLRL